MADAKLMIINSIVSTVEEEILKNIETISKPTKYGKILIDYDHCIQIIKVSLKKFKIDVESEFKLADRLIK